VSPCVSFPFCWDPHFPRALFRRSPLPMACSRSVDIMVDLHGLFYCRAAYPLFFLWPGGVPLTPSRALFSRSIVTYPPLTGLPRAWFFLPWPSPPFRKAVPPSRSISPPRGDGLYGLGSFGSFFYLYTEAANQFLFLCLHSQLPFSPLARCPMLPPSCLCRRISGFSFFFFFGTCLFYPPFASGVYFWFLFFEQALHP